MTRSADDATCYILTLSLYSPAAVGEYMIVARGDSGVADGVVELSSPAMDSALSGVATVRGIIEIYILLVSMFLIL
jgi:hypothetical protein